MENALHNIQTTISNVNHEPLNSLHNVLFTTRVLCFTALSLIDDQLKLFIVFIYRIMCK